MKKHLFLLLSIAFLSACLGGGTPIPQDHFYRLAEATPTTIRPNTLGIRRLTVARFDSDDLHRERAILYSHAATPERLQRYHYHHWVAPPGGLIQSHLIDYLRQMKFAEHISRPEDNLDDNARLSGIIKRFERRIDTNLHRVVVELELTLRYRRAPHNVMFTRTYQVETPSQSGEMHSTAKAFAESLEKIYQQFIQDLPTAP